VRLPRVDGISLQALRPITKLKVGERVGGGTESRVLYIEDNLASVQVIQRLLANRSNTTLYVALSGQIGIDLARQHRPTVILLDLHLPDLGGDMILQRLRLEPITQHIPVVILSADANVSSIRRLLEAGATSYLTKPIDLNELLALLETTAEPVAPVVAPGRAEGAPSTVLYIEDSTLNTDLAARLVQRRSGIELLVAHSGRNGLRMARAQRPDLVLLDRRLPDMTGDDILAALRASPDTSLVPVVVLSGDSGQSQIGAMLAAGANEFLAKPFSAHDFLTVIDRWCPPELRQE
jgi:CheY-like chemotaxis protein